MKERGNRKKLVGVVLSNSMDKTAVVRVSRLKKHKTYKKYIRGQKKFMAHDPQNLCQVGDKVRLVETRPLSKRKRWKVTEILERVAINGGAENSDSGA
ncbi:MAG: 30S ribosomal protein S17 [Deltaproteobacteria bacterium]|nr:30S ribosomal protein S17 [Deltaproteobacteria bacterium]MBW2016239.1 30S ribosomal protein S17 [Deltaproteobacteria bacterium]MBW2130058.1 30S ribosomal protein S17 [Deltaproteobacteria bacterium]MBW2304315.1 30S ribosomal protein S17 [Deltaproteobacteria bacterium]